MNNPFYFTNDFNNLEAKTSLVAIISSAEGEKELFKELNKKLRLPDYFGFNWDALDECMNNFEWIQEKIIVLIHEGLPSLKQSDLKIYLSILRDAVLDWQKSPQEHILEVYFPKEDETVINELSLD